MALAKYLTPNLRVSLLERRRTDLVERLAEVRAGAHNEQLDTYARSVMEHAAAGRRVGPRVDRQPVVHRTTVTSKTFAREAK